MAIMSVLWSLLRCDIDSGLPNGLRDFVVDETTYDVREPVGCTAQQFAAAALLRSIPKKFQGEVDREYADSNAFKLFHECNARCRDWQLNTGELGPYDEVILGEFKKTMWEFFNPHGFPLLDLAKIERYADFGPGRSPGVEGTSFPWKIGHDRLTATSHLLIGFFDQWCRSSSLRMDCEIARSLSYGSPTIAELALITPVLKKREISRLVKGEPPLNMFFQKGAQAVLEDQLFDYFGINLATQPAINAELARMGSITGQIGTIDLKSASDLIARNFCREYVPRSSFTWLDLLRSPEAKAQEGEIVTLHMMATMGNAFCFPLQTAIFASAVTAVYKALGIPMTRFKESLTYRTDPLTGEVVQFFPDVTLPNWGVFGDDIVVDWEAYRPLIRLLRALGFIPNETKSFNDGCFRESCGSDWYNGTNVRGVYVETLDTMQDWYALINKLVDWSAAHGIMLYKTIEWCESHCRRTLVPPWENPDSGIRVPLACVDTLDVAKAPARRGFAPRSTLTLKFGCNVAFPDLHGSYLYKRYVPQKYKITDVTDATALLPSGEENCYHNSSAILLGAVKGAIRGGRVEERAPDGVPTRYKLRSAVAPCWDYLPPGDPRKPWEQSWLRTAKGYFTRESNPEQNNTMA